MRPTRPRTPLPEPAPEPTPGAAPASSAHDLRRAHARRRAAAAVGFTTALATGTLAAVALPAHAADPATWKFDLGTATSPVADGYRQVTEATRYDASTGFGIVPADGVTPISRDRGTTDAADRDFVLATAWSFVVDVPNGTYDVTVRSGDLLATSSTTTTNLTLEGATAGTLKTKQVAAEGTWRTTVADGQLTLGVTGAGAGGYVNAVVVTAVPGEPGTDPDPEPTPDPAIAAPTALRLAHVSPGAVTLRWNEVAGATGYVLTRADALAGPYTEVARTTRDVFATDAAVDTTTTHWYRVQTLTATGASVPSAAAVSSLAGDGVPDPTLPADGVLAFDLGSGALVPGSTRLDATSAYGPTARAGFVDPSQVTATDRGTADALRSDFVTVGDTELVVDLPAGDYTVDLVAGDTAEASEIAITAEQMAKVATTAKPAGQFLEMSFDIAVVDGQLNLDFAGTAPKLNALTIRQQSPRTAGPKPTVWVTGDSTVQSYTADYAPQAGWGQMIDRYLSDDVVVDNRAIGGRSSKNFISQGRLDEVLRLIKPGDYLFVQFGHNDNSYGVDDRYAAPADYREYLRTYVDGARQRGATPVLVTPVSRRSFDATTGRFNVSFPEYVAAATALAAETGTPLVDLSASSRAYLDEIGPEAAKAVFLHVPAGVYPGRPAGTVDDTHFQEYGAIQMARLVATDVAALDVPLAGEVEGFEPPAAVPDAPAGVVAGNVSNAGVQLTWTPVEGADVYRVYRKDAAAGDDAYALVATSTLAQAAVGGLVEGASYDLRVTAVNGRGESAPSATVRVTTKAALYKFDVQLAGSPVMPGYVEVNQNSRYTPETGWGWLDPTGMGGRDRGTNFPTPPNDLQRDFLLPGPQHVLAVDVPDGSYAVKTYNGDWIGTSRSNVQIEGKDWGASNAGAGAVSEKVSQPVLVTDGQLSIVMTGSSSRLNGVEITPLLLAPQDLVLDGVSIDGAAVSVALSWTGTDDSAGYRVYRQASGAAAPVAIGETTDPAFVDTAADVGLAYRYHVVALDPSGAESVPTDVLDVTTVDPSVPVAGVPFPVTLGAVNKNDVTVRWSPVDGALFYQVYRSESVSGPYELVGRASTASWTDTTVLTTIAYSYRVASVNAGGVSAQSLPVTSPAVTTLSRQAERLDRSPVAVAVDGGVYVGWRMLGTDPESIGFHVYRDGRRITGAPIGGSTNTLDGGGSAASAYRVSSVVDGIERWATPEFRPWDQQHLDVPLDKPADAYAKDGQPYTYNANDASVGDLDGDGQDEIVVKWDPSNSKDNSQAGYTGNVYLDAYELDGTRLWRVDLGRNIRAGAHYTQFQVFDLDGDGRAEVTAKTADGTVDGVGGVIGDARADYRNSSGYVLTGPEFLTVFDGRSGAAVDTVDYTPPRGDVSAWGDAYGNRVDRFLAGVAYLDGEHPSLVVSRGYYTRTVIATYDFDGAQLVQRWVFDSDVEGDRYKGQGNHNLSVADVDGDQKDEIVFGSMTIDDDGDPLYVTGLGHGDALHVSDLDPSRPGLEVFAAHEEAPSSKGIGATFRDARTGEVLWSMPATRDTGRAASGDVDPDQPGAESWAVVSTGEWNSRSGELRAADGTLLGTSIPAANFLTWWDGDLLREITDHDWDTATTTGVPTIAKWSPSAGAATEVYRATGTLSNNGTKGTPALQADLFGDWREELVTRLADSSALRIATTVDVTQHRLRTLQSDPVYRLGVAWQNTAYNQPPHTSYFLGAGMTTPPAPRLALTGADPGPGERVPGPATGAPARGALSSDNWDDDGTYTVALNVWWGQNAHTVTLLENGVEIARRDLVDATPTAQSAAFQVAGRGNGTYVYTAVLTNQHGSTTTAPLTVVVSKANPATPVLSHDNRDGDGAYTVTTNLWWGTNATEYRLYEDGVLVDTQTLVANGVHAQKATTTVTGRAVGTHVYRAELSNAAGTTSSTDLKVVVRR
ncbi:GDSL-type esterase/lipase family protein [Cellulomonas algicola]|uniref:rhamnogalacturonan lyase family protein n=1 Tax=Cellulomonas algicola TaxID=2071633 RepID=UPI001C3F71E2|nr:fibronectin type III domain-containing protein [Cellulomonas algicola]